MFVAMLEGLKEESVGFLFNLQVEVTPPPGGAGPGRQRHRGFRSGDGGGLAATAAPRPLPTQEAAQPAPAQRHRRSAQGDRRREPARAHVLRTDRGRQRRSAARRSGRVGRCHRRRNPSSAAGGRAVAVEGQAGPADQAQALIRGRRSARVTSEVTVHARVGLLSTTGCDARRSAVPGRRCRRLRRARLHRAQVHADERRDAESPGRRLRQRERAHDVDERRRHQRPQLPHVAAPIQHFEDQPERRLRESLDVRRAEEAAFPAASRRCVATPASGATNGVCRARPRAARPDGTAERPGRGGAGT